MNKITFCIPSKDNLRYLKTCIPSIRKNAYRKDHDIIIFVDSDNDGTVEWLKENQTKYNYTYYINPELGTRLYGIGKAYDYCVEKSTTEVFTIFHADMMLGKDADLKAFEHLKPKTAVCATRIEPPIHPNDGEKIQLDFGMWPEEWKEEAFNSYVQTQLTEAKITEGIFAPWMMYRDEFLAIGGHDPMMHSCREDSDVFNRMKLAGFKFIQPWNSLVYHLTGRGAGSFGGDLERHEKWKRDMDNSTREFIRKWGSTVKHSALMDPIVTPKYDIGFVVKNCSPQLLPTLELFCSAISSDASYSEYLQTEQPNTRFDLTKRIKPWNSSMTNDIIVEFDAMQLNGDYFALLQQLPDIIAESGEIGEFELGIFKITIRALNRYESELVRLDSKYYTDQLI